MRSAVVEVVIAVETQLIRRIMVTLEVGSLISLIVKLISFVRLLLLIVVRISVERLPLIVLISLVARLVVTVVLLLRALTRSSLERDRWLGSRLETASWWRLLEIRRHLAKLGRRPLAVRPPLILVGLLVL